MLKQLMKVWSNIFCREKDLARRVFFLRMCHELFMILYERDDSRAVKDYPSKIRRCKNIEDHDYIDFEIFA